MSLDFLGSKLLHHRPRDRDRTSSTPDHECYSHQSQGKYRGDHASWQWPLLAINEAQAKKLETRQARSRRTPVAILGVIPILRPRFPPISSYLQKRNQKAPILPHCICTSSPALLVERVALDRPLGLRFACSLCDHRGRNQHDTPKKTAASAISLLTLSLLQKSDTTLIRWQRQKSARLTNSA